MQKMKLEIYLNLSTSDWYINYKNSAIRNLMYQRLEHLCNIIF